MTIETERLLLRPWVEDDAAACYRYASDPRVGPAAGWPAHQSVEESRRVIREILAVPETYAVVLRETGLPVGSISLHFHTELIGGEGECELGYWIGAPYWGRGLIPEAARALLRHAFLDLGMQKVWCCYHDGNERSRRVQEKCGFRPVGPCRDLAVSQMNEVRPTHVNCLTRAEWQRENE